MGGLRDEEAGGRRNMEEGGGAKAKELVEESAKRRRAEEAPGEGMDVDEVVLEEQYDVFYDDMSGETLKPELVRKARQEEMRTFRELGVYEKVPLQQCYDETGKPPISVRWVDINKGDLERPEYRSRLVAKEIKRDKREDLLIH